MKAKKDVLSLASCLLVLSNQLYKACAAETVLQVDQATLHDVRIKDKHSGYTGSGYGDYADGETGSYIDWEYTADSDGDHDISIRYSTAKARALELYVNNEWVDTFPCEGTGSWRTWLIETRTVSLSQGINDISLVAEHSTGPNVDWLSVSTLGRPGPSPTPAPVPNPTLAPVPNPTLAPVPSPTLAPVPDPTLAPVPSPTTAPVQVSAAIKYQAEAPSVESGDVSIVQTHTGYDGTGYGDYQGNGAYLLWEVFAPTSDDYEVTVRFAAGSSRPCEFYVDGVGSGAFSFSGTGSWSTWVTESLQVSLSQGSHEVMVIAENSNGPNIDWLSLRQCDGGCGGPVSAPTPTPVVPPTPSPVVQPTQRPVVQPTQTPVARPTRSPVQPTPSVDFPESVVLNSNSRLDRGDFVSSPNGEYKVGLTSGGRLVLQDKRSNTIWDAGVSNGHRCFMQSDGNVIVRSGDGRALFTTKTFDHRGSQLVVDDGGQIVVKDGDIAVWLDGIPRGQYRRPGSDNLSFPVRGIFYYSWYPKTWTVNGQRVHFQPDLGWYSNSDPEVIDSHIDAFDYAWIDLVITSWWGPETNLDRARITFMMDKMIAAQSGSKMSFYHEDEREHKPAPAQIKEDLDYLKKWFAWHPAWAHIERKPVIFVFNEAGCDVASRWMAASNDEWYVVLKLFPGYLDCSVQPDHWHQYGVNNGDPLEYRDVSFTIAPGFWRADKSTPKVPRVSQERWCNNVNQMVQSQQPWQLIVSFNEHGEATGIEPSSHWASDTGYGYYLDCLNQYH